MQGVRDLQRLDQLGPLAETPSFGGTRGGEVGFNLFQHPRQRDGQREKGAVEIGGVVHFGSYAAACEAIASGPAGVGGFTTRHRSRGVIRASRLALCPRAPRHMECRQSFGSEPAYTRRCERRGHHASGERLGQADKGLTASAALSPSEARASFLSQGVLSAALPAQGPQQHKAVCLGGGSRL
jgi:hypothetical protein